MRTTFSKRRAPAFGQVSRRDLLEAELFFEDLTGQSTNRTRPSIGGRDMDYIEGEAFDESIRSADITAELDRPRIDPLYSSDDGQSIPRVWEDSDRLFRILATKQLRGRKDIEFLENALRRQVRTVETYRNVVDYFDEPETGSIHCYVLLFPGEARDNTGIKDLNDKVIGYQLNGEYIEARQSHIRDTFDGKFSVVGQDYKTAIILTKTGPRKEFDKRLRRLDAKLRTSLLAILGKAEKRWKDDQEKLKNIRKLRKRLRKKSYRFDIYYGLRDGPAIPKGLRKSRAITWCFILITEALKAAAIGRYITKGRRDRKFGRAVKRDRWFDRRGKVFRHREYLKVVKQAGDIKQYVTTPYSSKHPWIFNTIWVETVWTLVFYKRRRIYYPNPDVIRAVRKQRLEKPRIKDRNLKFNFKAQKRILELWLIVLNTLDFVKDFLRRELSDEVFAQHHTAAKMLEDLSAQQPAVDWDEMRRVLSTDVRLKVVAALGRASEHLFYSPVASQQEWIIFSMDVRDLGVALMILYEDSNEEIEDRNLSNEKLLSETFRSTDPINKRMRFTYDQVVRVFRKRIHRRLRREQAAARKAAATAFGRRGQKVHGTPAVPWRAVRVMLGGDEIFVAAHPTYAPYVPLIIKTLHDTPLRNGHGEKLNMRTVVAFSRAMKPSFNLRNPFAIPSQRDENKRAHQQSLDACDAAPKLLKDLEGQNRRIERLIAILARKPEEKEQVRKFRRRLKKLGLIRLYIQIGYGKPKALSISMFRQRLARLRSGRLNVDRGETLVDFNGKTVDRKALKVAADKLEQEVREKVGKDNTHIDPPPIGEIPKIPKWLDDYLDGDDSEDNGAGLEGV